jgi:flagellar hook protein FlgE
MGIYGALITAVSGLQAQSYSLENISGNIANSQTTGFKRLDTNFVDLIPDQIQSREAAGSVLAYSKGTNNIQGDITTTKVGTNVAINGTGYFTVAQRTDFAGGEPVFGGTALYTRRGDFEVDKNGYLINGAGYYLKGFSIDPVSGSQVGSQAGVIKINRDQLPPAATTKVEYRANLPATPATQNYQKNNSAIGSELLAPSLTTAPAVPPLGIATIPYATQAQKDLFNNTSITGATIQVYSKDGTPATLQLQWAKTDNTPGANKWSAYVQTDSGVGVLDQWINVGNFTFDAAGNLAPAVASFPVPAATINGVTLGALTFDISGGGVKQYYDASQKVQASSVKADGYSTGVLNDVAVDAQGRVVGNYSNGQILPLAQITVAQFNADNALKRKDGGVFEQTLESGPPLVGQNGAKLVASALESSNTDISTEFSKMIITQQAYSANTKVITTAQEMLRDVIAIIR